MGAIAAAPGNLTCVKSIAPMGRSYRYYEAKVVNPVKPICTSSPASCSSIRALRSATPKSTPITCGTAAPRA